MKVRRGAVVRGAGAALSCFASAPTLRSQILFAAYAVGWPLDRPGLQVLVVVPEADEPWKRATVPFATSVASWSAAMLLASAALRRTALPTPVAAVLLGGIVVVADSFLADLVEARKAASPAVEPPVAAEPADD